ncbi:hypothetical protein MLD38_017594 [Melastoma candidum]|uniref:Uncharacterized protein n=1 Tax=Melastoma candidum TaxID=119954 RepID=A0ACB9QV69_9MYRT|nr:hypothetical protein MLD38_017594 [Melastoma candidum]
MTSGMLPQPHTNPFPPARVRLSDIEPHEGPATAAYSSAVEALSGSLTRYNAVVIELAAEDSAIMRCGLDATRMYFRMTSARWQVQSWKGSGVASPRGFYVYRAGRDVDDVDSTPPCMEEIFKCMGKVARVALCAIARHLCLRSDEFVPLLDDIPLPANQVSSSMLVASHLPLSSPNGSGAVSGIKQSFNGEVEKGLLTLISSDCPGLQVCDPNGHWYLADGSSSPGNLVLVTGKALSHVTAGLRPAAFYRVAPGCLSSSTSNGRLIPQSKAMLDCSRIAAAGHVIPQSLVPVSASQFMNDLSVEDDLLCSPSDIVCATASDETPRRTLRSILSDPLTGTFLEDAVVVSCGHSFGGSMLKRVLEMSRCTVCCAKVKASPLIPNHALRAAAAAVKHEDDRRLFHNAALRKKRKDMGDQTDIMRNSNKENGDTASEDSLHKGAHYPFTINEKVLIKGNKRTPEKFVGKEAVIASQCLNGWYLLKIIGSGENMRLQYRSLQKIINSEASDDRCLPRSMTNGGL